MAIRMRNYPSTDAGNRRTERRIAALARVCMVLLVVALAGLGCKDKREQPAGMQPGVQAGEPAGEQVTGLSDAEIAAVARAANLGEIQTSMMAQTQAQDQEVREFARRMVDEHSTANQRLQSLAAARNITPVENELSRQLTTEANAAMSKLRPLAGEQFDRAYMDAQIMLHQRVLNMLDTKLVLAASDPQLKSELENLRSHVADHLERAQEIQRKLGSGGGEQAPGAGQPQS